jgi:2-polyprenyl-3-methyl-5-hydroxy-6-metoxy-1,4-benzoquinol methylase
MLKKIARAMIGSKAVSNILIVPFLRLHNLLYRLSTVAAIGLNNGVHPKHHIVRYKEWFLRNISDNDVVLDVGCNTGMMANLMSKKASFVYAVDIDSAHIKVAEKTFSSDKLLFICADATELDFSLYDAIDVVTLSNVLEHIDKRVFFLKKLVVNIRWADRPKFLIRVPMINRDWLVIYKKELGVEYLLDRTHFVEYTYNEFLNEINNAGLEVLSHNVKFGEIYAICQA